MTRRDGLAGLLGESARLAQGVAAGRITTLRADQLRPGASQPRRQFGEAGLETLAQSIREKGVLQPLLVRPVDGAYELVAGERRWRAAQLAGLSELPVIIRAMTDQEAAVVALIENLQRENLNLIDEVEGKLLLVAGALGLPREQARTRLNELLRHPDPAAVETLAAVFAPLGRETWQSFAKNKVRILNYPAPLVEALRRGMALTLATLIARAPEGEQTRLIRLAEDGTGRKEIAAEVERLSKRPTPSRAKQVGRFLASKRMDTLSPGAAERVQRWLAQMPRELEELLGEES